MMRKLLTLACVAAFLPLAGASAKPLKGDWPQYGFGPQGTRANPYETAINKKTVSRLAVAWQTQGKSTYGAPALAGGVLYAVADRNKLTAFDAASGHRLWAAALLGGSLNMPVVDGGRIFVSTYPAVRAFDAASGAKLWTFKNKKSDAFSTPVAAHGRVFFGDQQGRLRALDARTGTPLWTSDLYASSPDVAPAVSDGIVYGAGLDGEMRAFDAAHGTLLWEQRADSNLRAPAVTDGLVIVNSNTRISAFDAKTGAAAWATGIGTNQNSPLAYTHGHAFALTQDHVFWDYVTATGALHQGEDADVGAVSPVAIAGGMLFAGTTDIKFGAFDLKTGANLWSSTPLAQMAVDAPIVAGGRLYFSAGPLYAFSLDGAK